MVTLESMADEGWEVEEDSGAVLYSFVGEDSDDEGGGKAAAGVEDD